VAPRTAAEKNTPVSQVEIAWLSAHQKLWGAIEEPYQADLCQMMADCQAPATKLQG